MRLFLLAGIAGFLLLIAAVVLLGSPTEKKPPKVGALRPIEEIWAIEDARQQSAAPLVTSLMQDGTVLGCEPDASCFYCPLPLDSTQWPELNLTAGGNGEVQMCFVDDYQYDDPQTAISGAYPYQVIAYTDKEFSYFSVVFTGMTQTCLYAEEELTLKDDVPVTVSVNDGSTAITHAARAHLRGGVTAKMPKRSYRIEFTRKTNGKKKTEMDVPGLGVIKNIVLLPMVFDTTFMRDRLSWDLYAQMTEEGEPFGARKMQYTELYVNGEYEGLYLMLEPYDYKQEFAKAGESHESTDCFYRVSGITTDGDHAWTAGYYLPARGFRLLYKPASLADDFAACRAYFALAEEKDDGVYADEAETILDTETMLRMEALIQAGGMADNILNNLDIWADCSGGKTYYRFYPWDMDATWGDRTNRVGEDFDYWMYFPSLDRLIQLDANGMRGRVYAYWQRMRESVFTEENVEALTSGYIHMLNDSGAVARNAARWELEDTEVNAQAIMDFCGTRFAIMDNAFRYISEETGEIEFLTFPDYGSKSTKIYFPPDWH